MSTLIVVTNADNDWHDDFVGVYASLEAAARDLEVVWTEHVSSGYVTDAGVTILPERTYWLGTTEERSKYRAETTEVIA